MKTLCLYLLSYGHYDDDDGYGDYHGGGYDHGYSDYHHEGGYDDHGHNGYTEHDEHGYGHSDHDGHGHKRKGGEGHYSYKNVNQHGQMTYHKSPDTYYREDYGYYDDEGKENYPEYYEYQHDVHDKMDSADKKGEKAGENYDLTLKSKQASRPRINFDHGF